MTQTRIGRSSPSDESRRLSRYHVEGIRVSTRVVSTRHYRLGQRLMGVVSFSHRAETVAFAVPYMYPLQILVIPRSF